MPRRRAKRAKIGPPFILPTDIFNCVLKFFRPVDFYNVSLVCKAFASMINDRSWTICIKQLTKPANENSLISFVDEHPVVESRFRVQQARLNDNREQLLHSRLPITRDDVDDLLDFFTHMHSGHALKHLGLNDKNNVLTPKEFAFIMEKVHILCMVHDRHDNFGIVLLGVSDRSPLLEMTRIGALALDRTGTMDHKLLSTILDRCIGKFIFMDHVYDLAELRGVTGQCRILCLQPHLQAGWLPIVLENFPNLMRLHVHGKCGGYVHLTQLRAAKAKKIALMRDVAYQESNIARLSIDAKKDLEEVMMRTQEAEEE
jgi:hypothetical protein